MVINRKNKFVFIHNPKTAGMTVTRHLLEIRGSVFYKEKRKHMPVIMLNHLSVPSDFFRFAFVRNPWDRYVSWYHYKLRRGQDSDELRSFEVWVRHCYDISQKNNDTTYTHPQLSWTHIGRKQVVDFVGYYENLDEDLKKVGKIVGIASPELKHENASKHKDYREYYTEETKQMLAEIFAEDIELFGYTFEGRQ